MHENIKQALVKARETDTRLMFRTLRNSARVLSNAVSEEVIRLERRPGGVEFSELQPLVAGARGRATLQSGEVDEGVVWAGQVVGLIDDIPTCAKLLERMVRACRERLAAAAAMC